MASCHFYDMDAHCKVIICIASMSVFALWAVVFHKNSTRIFKYVVFFKSVFVKYAKIRYLDVRIKKCFTEVKQVFLLYLWYSLVTLELISLIPLVGPPFTDPLAVELLDNRLCICVFTHTHSSILVYLFLQHVVHICSTWMTSCVQFEKTEG